MSCVLPCSAPASVAAGTAAPTHLRLTLAGTHYTCKAGAAAVVVLARATCAVLPGVAQVTHNTSDVPPASPFCRCQLAPRPPTPCPPAPQPFLHAPPLSPLAHNTALPIPPPRENPGTLRTHLLPGATSDFCQDPLCPPSPPLPFPFPPTPLHTKKAPPWGPASPPSHLPPPQNLAHPRPTCCQGQPAYQAPGLG
jgi:hypothetical protein